MRFPRFRNSRALYSQRMLAIVQLVYLHPGQERVFDEFETLALALLAKHGGELLLRLRPTERDVIARSIELPYEIHIVRFPSNDAFAQFAADDDRQRFLHLKSASVRSELVIREVSSPV